MPGRCRGHPSAGTKLWPVKTSWWAVALMIKSQGVPPAALSFPLACPPQIYDISWYQALLLCPTKDLQPSSLDIEPIALQSFFSTFCHWCKLPLHKMGWSLEGTGTFWIGWMKKVHSSVWPWLSAALSCSAQLSPRDAELLGSAGWTLAPWKCVQITVDTRKQTVLHKKCVSIPSLSFLQLFSP